MLPTNLRITLIIAVCCYFILILVFLKRKALELKYTLLWLLAGVVMGAFVIFPRLLFYLTKMLGIESPMNGLYVLCIGFIIIILMALTSIVSRQSRMPCWRSGLERWRERIRVIICSERKLSSQHMIPIQNSFIDVG